MVFHMVFGHAAVEHFVGVRCNVVHRVKSGWTIIFSNVSKIIHLTKFRPLLTTFYRSTAPLLSPVLPPGAGLFHGADDGYFRFSIGGVARDPQHIDRVGFAVGGGEDHCGFSVFAFRGKLPFAAFLFEDVEGRLRPAMW